MIKKTSSMIRPLNKSIGDKSINKWKVNKTEVTKHKLNKQMKKWLSEGLKFDHYYQIPKTGELIAVKYTPLLNGNINISSYRIGQNVERYATASLIKLPNGDIRLEHLSRKNWQGDKTRGAFRFFLNKALRIRPKGRDIVVNAASQVHKTYYKKFGFEELTKSEQGDMILRAEVIEKGGAEE